MTLIETTEKYRAESENEAKEMMEAYRKDASEKGYNIKKAGYEHKTKKAKGEIADECWLVTVIKTFGGIWE